MFDAYLHRSLLWQRADDPLSPIEEFRGAPAPSRSWMAHTGTIRYLDVPLGRVRWSRDVISPFSKSGEARNGGGDRDAAAAPELEAPVWGLTGARGGRTVMDDPGRSFAQAIRCVVVGREIVRQTGEHQICWVLLVCAAGTGGAPVYKRVGVGVLERRHIAFDLSQESARIR